ncbi:tumor necrosis factor ligand superfamily member 13 isoform X2 [Orcinus orca]|uniref:tumor necrosis factor ligand superfamily member 13 isoform X2 n=1 Tax=Orcinus orca TaxID=9733 RepID=UPI002111B712|nr:tumor necrosis factor ligand superfamily member 13 isoform X2 [Orcinus orca]
MPTSSPSLLAPKGPPGDMGGPVREPALSVALWLSWGAALGAVACAMVLLTQQTELQTLRREVSRLQRTGGPSEKGEGYLWLSPREQILEDSQHQDSGCWGKSSDGVEALENGEKSRRRRAVKQKKKRSVLHLVPVNITSKEDSDVTEVMWQPALWRGRGLEAQGYVIRVWDAGIYLLYSQVSSASPLHKKPHLHSPLSIYWGPVSITDSRGVIIMRPSAEGAQRRRCPCSHIITLRVPTFAFHALHCPGAGRPL